MDSLIDLLASGQDLFMNREVGTFSSATRGVRFGADGVAKVKIKKNAGRALGARQRPKTRRYSL